MLTLTDAQLENYVKHYAPEFHFHSSEPYYPTTVDAYLKNVVLIDPNAPQSGTPTKGVSDAALQAASAASYLQIAAQADQSVIRGNNQQVTVYVHVRTVDMPGATPYYDLQYWVFYAMRAASLGKFSNALWSGPIFSLDPCGEHQGDWKYVTVRLDASGNLVSVFYSAHTSGTWYQAADKGSSFQTNAQGGPIVYVAQGSHSCFAQSGLTSVEASQSVPTTVIYVPTITASVVEVTENGSMCQSTPVIVDGVDTATHPAWLNFQGIWGPHETQKFSLNTLENAVLSGLVAAPWSLTVLPLVNAYIAIFKSWLEAGAATPSNQAGWTGWVCVDVSSVTSGFGVVGDPVISCRENGTTWVYACMLGVNNDGVSNTLMMYYLGPQAPSWEYNNVTDTAKPFTWVNGPACISSDAAHIYIAGGNGHLIEYDLTSPGGVCNDITNVTQGGQIISSGGMAYSEDDNGDISLFVQGPDNQLGLYYKPANGGWAYDNLSYSAQNGQPISAAPVMASNAHIYVAGTNQHLLDYAWDADANGWVCTDITAITPQTPTIASTPAIYVDDQGAISIWGVSSEQHLLLFYKPAGDNTTWAPDDFSLEDRVPGTQHVSGAPAASSTGQVYAVGATAGHLLQFSYVNGGWKLTDLTGAAYEGATVTGTPAVYEFVDGTISAFARSTNHLMWYTNQ